VNRSHQPADAPRRAIGYSRVSTGQQVESGLGMDAQRAAIEAEATHRGWELLEVATDAGISGSTLRRRPALRDVLDRLDHGQADVLVVAKLDRLARSVVDLGTILRRAQKRGWALVALDLGVDTSTSTGELVANVMMSVAQWERRRIGERVGDTHAQRRRRGLRAGEPPRLPEDVRRRIADEVAAGRTLRTIADNLAADDIPPLRGTRWHPSTIRHVARSVALDHTLQETGR
jgi:DNA invertase Pin-like site-specific DNA recombinase